MPQRAILISNVSNIGGPSVASDLNSPRLHLAIKKLPATQFPHKFVSLCGQSKAWRSRVELPRNHPPHEKAAAGLRSAAALLSAHVTTRRSPAKVRRFG